MSQISIDAIVKEPQLGSLRPLPVAGDDSSSHENFGTVFERVQGETAPEESNESQADLGDRPRQSVETTGTQPEKKTHSESVAEDSRQQESGVVVPDAKGPSSDSEDDSPVAEESLDLEDAVVGTDPQWTSQQQESISLDTVDAEEVVIESVEVETEFSDTPKKEPKELATANNEYGIEQPVDEQQPDDSLRGRTEPVEAGIDAAEETVEESLDPENSARQPAAQEKSQLASQDTVEQETTEPQARQPAATVLPEKRQNEDGSHQQQRENANLSPTEPENQVDSNGTVSPVAAQQVNQAEGLGKSKQSRTEKKENPQSPTATSPGTQVKQVAGFEVQEVQSAEEQTERSPQPDVAASKSGKGEQAEVNTKNVNSGEPSEAKPVQQRIPLGQLSGLRNSSEAGPRDDLTQGERVRLVQRVANAVRAAGDRGGEVRLRLAPPELGALRIELTVERGVMSARLEAETPAARNVLLDNLPALRQRLAEQDIKIANFDVDLMEQSFDQAQQERSELADWQSPHQSRSQQNNRQQDSTETEAESEPAPSRASVINSDGELNIVI